MRKSLKLLILMMLLFINIGFTGCLNDTKANLSQNQNTRKQNPKIQELNLKTQEKDFQKQTNKKVLLEVPIIAQKPELKNGCEITSLTMLLRYAGIKVDKMTLAEEIKKDKTPLLHDEEGNIKQWGNPNDGFAVYPKPISPLNHYCKVLIRESQLLSG